MKRTLLLAALASVSPYLHAKPEAPTIEQMAAFPAISSLSLSPDGQHIAGLRANGEERVIVVWRTDALDKPPTVIGANRMKFQSVSFIKNGQLAVVLWQPYDLRADRVTKTFVSKFFITDIEGKQWKEPITPPRASSRSEELEQALANATVLDTLPNDPDHILVVNGSGSSSGDVYKVDLRNFTSQRIQKTEERVAGYITDLDSELRARLRQDVDGTGAYVATEFRSPATGTWEEHFRSYVKNRDVNQVIGFADDPNIAFVLSNVGRDKAIVYEYDISARKQKEVLFEHKLFNAGSMLINRFRNGAVPFGEIMGIGYAGPRGDDMQWTSPRMKALDQGLRQALGITQEPLAMVDTANGQRFTANYDTGVSLRILDYTADLSNVLVATSGPSNPPEYHLLHNGKLTLLAKTYPQIQPAALGQTRLVYYKARDGLDIPAFLTTPSTELCGAGPWKAVVHPHGGPWARDGMDFDGSMWVPLMASRCMAVLRPQFRGSADWGRKLWMAGDAEWGQKMQDDKDDGAQWMIDQKIARPGHIAMFGFSYGGYSAFAASVRPNGLYKCAIAGAGVSDIKKIWSRFYTNPFFRQAQAPTVAGLNPVDKAGEMKIPLMVYHGDRDRTVPIEQSEWFVNKAKGSGQPVEFHAIADYAHGPAWTRRIMADQLQLIDDYLGKGCGGGGL
ncbi:alpha/beta hydrolase family protein [Stenotrophomonas maltophilia]|jgi:dipeptidyl aminopeptidase/acylaminoacyl peptidase|uniref:alpha/beta hydrolase family protein n=1 Tax=Stenotrophomonas TaxID=40323 RepID=UPI00201CE3F0|nr:MULTISPECIES: prolyl oligopeptidase family serine peptidase [Stenotrophomonas]MBN5024427.1 S9 family peptidase [Stenotrophomonas maltophilia]MDH1273464.1 prolyl oligopeptidase family serine peptidase [Stenotrophomonas sp. GD03937]MDH1487136.1 prolyl oligopeptidase family serine peptidase [Stenotrophomonas sp. GD03712]MDR2960052.1 prolyl oligopeptidase family serine peptidase [Stenotrophomonas sp.]UQY95715.1 prolyl oligopeptidase family serine peptidase [Stenotrophomonas maltophilia]